MAACEDSASLCCRASMDRGIAVPIINRPCFEVSHRGPTLNELQSVVMCVYFCEGRTKYNTCSRPVSLPVRLIGRIHPRWDPRHEFHILRLIVRVFGDAEVKRTQMLRRCQTTELILEYQIRPGITHPSHSISGAPEPPHALCRVNNSGFPEATGARRCARCWPFCLCSELVLLPGCRVATRSNSTVQQFSFH